MEKFKPSENRLKTEKFKSEIKFNPVEKIFLGVTAELPDNYNNLDYHERRKANDIAYDNAICKHLTGEILNDHEEWRERQMNEAVIGSVNTLPNK